MGVSIIVTTYNDARFLGTALGSCLQQNIEKEIVLVDDCSTKERDVLASILRQYPVKYVRHESNQGLSAARNTGISVAKFDHVIVLDADDYFYPNAVPLLESQSGGFDIVCGYCTDSGNEYKPGIFHQPLTKELFIQDNPVICSSLFNKDIWKRAGGYMVRKGPHYEDWNFWAKCFAASGKFKAVNVKVYNHTSRPDSMLRELHPNRDFYRKLAVEGVFK